jgi:hypothetical protein
VLLRKRAGPPRNTMKKIIKEYHKGLKHRVSNFSIGMRTVKTALAISICLICFAVAKYLGMAVHNFFVL